ncbi:hypothetical protein FGO68_gene11768 [Halteria grandinella]|uniref:Uncharacterized protein n=1 Tax=Halteria grandinella TaxID=5974 RepID=A0A8J8P3B0_HALGN|nr:hypothetical protein FGO68_gene11768 [Halteria grandinella]
MLERIEIQVAQESCLSLSLNNLGQCMLKTLRELQIVIFTLSLIFRLIETCSLSCTIQLSVSNGIFIYPLPLICNTLHFLSSHWNKCYLSLLLTIANSVKTKRVYRKVQTIVITLSINLDFGIKFDCSNYHLKSLKAKQMNRTYQQME